MITAVVRIAWPSPLDRAAARLVLGAHILSVCSSCHPDGCPARAAADDVYRREHAIRILGAVVDDRGEVTAGHVRAALEWYQ